MTGPLQPPPGNHPILLVRTDRIGDVILTTSCLDPLRASSPESDIDLLVQPALACLLAADPIARAIPCPVPRVGKGLHPARILHWKKRFRESNYRAAVFLHPDNDLQIAAALARIPVRIGYRQQIGRIALTTPIPYRRHLGEKHETLHNFDLLQILGCEPPASPLPRLHLTAKASAMADKMTTAPPYAVFHPLAHGDKPRWPAKHYARLANRLQMEYGWAIRIIGAAPDPAFLATFRRDTEPNIVWEDHSGTTDLEETTGLLAAAKLVVSRDSGPAHMGAALNRPLLCLMGQCDPVHSPERWAPPGEKTITLTADLPPLPGENRRHRWDRCFKSITPDEVFSAIQKLTGL